MVSTSCTANGVSLAQVKTSEKSNEITAIPLLIEVPDLKECMITIDVMGCQPAIVNQITEKKDIIFLPSRTIRRNFTGQ